MADVKTLRTQDELDLIDKVYGESYLEEQSFELARSAKQIDAQRKENVKLLAAFKDFCEERGIKWFVYGKTLQGVLAYNDFVPEESHIDLGMLRPDFLQFEHAYSTLAEPERKKLPWTYSPYYEGTKTRRIFGQVHSKKRKVVTFHNEVVFDIDQLPLTAAGLLPITVFDEVPDDFFTRKKFYRQMKRRNDAFKKGIYAHRVPDGDEEGFERDSTVIEPISTDLFGLLPLRCLSWGMHSLAHRYGGRNTQMIARVTGWRSVTLPKNDIGSTQWKEFAGITVRCPDRPDIWAKEPLEEPTPELVRLQQDAKEIVSEIDRVCHELGINYFCCGGTMLGYVRHGGFIPWDDDIDCGMLREDYERFKAEAGALIDSDRFFLQTRESDPSIPYLFSKLRLCDSNYITEYNKFRHFQKGICVDIFPFDYVPNGVADQSAFRDEVLAVSKRHNHIVNRQYTDEQIHEMSADCKNIDYAIAHLTGSLLAHHYRGMSLVQTQADYDSVVTRYDYAHKELGLRYVASFVPSYTMAKVTDLFPTQRVQFDEIEIEIPKNPEIFLTMQYGDFMVMPYLHQRTGHDLLLWSDEQGVGGGREAEGAENGIQWG